MPITTTPSGGPQGEFSTYTPIYATTLSSNTAVITFLNIPTTFTDLAIIANFVGFTNTGTEAVSVRLNGDTGSNYSATYLRGNGSAASSARASNDNRMIVGATQAGTNTGAAMNIVNFMNYSNATTNKTILSRYSQASLQAEADVGLWRNTAPITSIQFGTYGTNLMLSGTSVTLYGIKAAAPAPKATGGDLVYTDNTYWYHVFNNSGIFDVKTPITANYLVVAGGGGGGYGYGGGGGGGGYRNSTSGELTGGGGSAETSLSLTLQQYTVTVGAGGPSRVAIGKLSAGYGGSGSNSVFSTITSTGGGGGGFVGNVGLTGGSGGGGGGTGGAPNAAGGARTASPVQGFDGGSANDNGGGGGGAGAVGVFATMNGGAGLSSSINGTATFRAGGGGGNISTSQGGVGGGGAVDVSGTANTGGGGGSQNGNGGSGVVIVRYPV
jgi:hypothetical protein